MKDEIKSRERIGNPVKVHDLRNIQFRRRLCELNRTRSKEDRTLASKESAKVSCGWEVRVSGNLLRQLGR
jgi:hypothetical protein